MMTLIPLLIQFILQLDEALKILKASGMPSSILLLLGPNPLFPKEVYHICVEAGVSSEVVGEDQEREAEGGVDERERYIPEELLDRHERQLLRELLPRLCDRDPLSPASATRLHILIQSSTLSSSSSLPSGLLPKPSFDLAAATRRAPLTTLSLTGRGAREGKRRGNEEEGEREEKAHPQKAPHLIWFQVPVILNGLAALGGDG